VNTDFAELKNLLSIFLSLFLRIYLSKYLSEFCAYGPWCATAERMHLLKTKMNIFDHFI
jgi:hypothetical protein